MPFLLNWFCDHKIQEKIQRSGSQQDQYALRGSNAGNLVWRGHLEPWTWRSWSDSAPAPPHALPAFGGVLLFAILTPTPQMVVIAPSPGTSDRRLEQAWGDPPIREVDRDSIDPGHVCDLASSWNPEDWLDHSGSRIDLRHGFHMDTTIRAQERTCQP